MNRKAKNFKYTFNTL